MNTHDRTTDTSSGSSNADLDLAEHDDVHSQGSTSRSILVAVNGGPSGWPALDWAAAEASAHHLSLRILHAISWPRWRSDPLRGLALDWCNTNAPDRGALILEEAARRAKFAAPHATITTHLESGEPAVTILKASRSDALIVVGHGRTRRPGGRSVARTIVRLGQCPIAVIRTPVASRPDGGRR